MKTPVVLSFALSLAGPFAFALERPVNWCTDRDACSAPQRQIWAAFQGAAGVGAAMPPAHFTGDCYFLSSWHEPARRSFGLAVLDRKGDSIFFRGRFAEFVDANPWEDLTFAGARDAVSMSYEDRFRLKLEPDIAQASVSDSPEHFIYYWFRTDPAGRTLFMLGQADGVLRSFCQLRRK